MHQFLSITDIFMNNPFDYTPSDECNKAYRKLLNHLESIKKSNRPIDLDFCRELEAGKMLGVLIATDSTDTTHTLYAFSGQIGTHGFHYDGFVEPVFDYLLPDGYFKIKEAEIVKLNREIADFSKNRLASLRTLYDQKKGEHLREISAYKETIASSKAKRNARRKSGLATSAELEEMIRQSQFEKAELHRLKKRLSTLLQPLETELNQANSYLKALIEKRRYESESLQNRLFSDFKVLNANGESKSLKDIFLETPFKTPPSGAGECCAPKLLQAAYLKGLKPVAMAEYWHGSPRQGEVRIHGAHYPACRGKCLPVLSWMLRGLDILPPLDSATHVCDHVQPEIIYENDLFCVVNKPSGMLSVPGKISALSVQQWLENRYGATRQVKVAHRLDRDTSGLLLAAFGNQNYKIIQSLFATRKIAKTYMALLEGDFLKLNKARSGFINLPLSPDLLDRPRQLIDPDNGKEAVTEYEFVETDGNRSRILFHPHTGRTHQLRVHAASQAGLGMPIAGDPLYGRIESNQTERLYLHAGRLEFTFPPDGEHYCFESPTPF